MSIQISAALDEAVMALTSFDLDRLEAVVQNLRSARVAPELLPVVSEKHAFLGLLLETTASNLKVLTSVSSFATGTKARMELR